MASLSALKTKHLRTLEILQTLQRENQKLRKSNAEYEALSNAKYTQEQVDSLLAERSQELEGEAQRREEELLSQLKLLEEEKLQQSRSYEEALQRLNSQADDHAEERKKLQEAGLQRRKSMTNMETTLFALRTDKKELEDQVAMLEKELTAQKIVSAESEKKRAELQEMIVKLQANTDQMNRYLDRLREQEAMMQKMRAELEAQEKKLSDLAAANKESKKLKEQLLEEKSKVISLETKLKNMKEVSSEDSDALNRLKANNSKLQRDIEQARRDIQRFEKQKAELEEALTATETRSAEENLRHMQEKEDLENQLVDMARRFKELSDSLVNGKSRFAEFVDLKAENKCLSKKVQKLEKRGSRRRRSAERLERNNSVNDRLTEKMSQQKQRGSLTRTPIPPAPGSKIPPRTLSNNTGTSANLKRAGLLV